MAVQQVFKRYEKKYLLTESQEKEFLKELNGRMIMDKYGRHTICNIYFDTVDFDLIRTSLEKPLYKEKLRLRTYGVPETDEHTAFVEIKKKFEGIVYKRRESMSLKEAEDYLYRGIHPQKDSQIIREIDWFLKVHPVKPRVCLTYERRAFYEDGNPQFRMTLDQNITCRDYRLSLTEGVFGDTIIPEGSSLLEIKIPGIMPMWMSLILSKLKIYPISISKYGRYYKNTEALNKQVNVRCRSLKLKEKAN